MKESKPRTIASKIKKVPRECRRFVRQLYSPLRTVILYLYRAFGCMLGYTRYHEYVLAENNKSDFVPITDSNYERKADDVKLVAFYLPQFHAIKENDQNFGKGFTEWTNVTKAKPQYIGHYQPHLPYDVGFYDLNTPHVMYRQIELAMKYGIYGFCFHYYWFSGDKLLEKPIQNYLNNKDLLAPFCLCWANENWTKTWDGGNREIIKEQILRDEDDEKFVKDILPYFQDSRYIKISGKPVLIIYRPHLFERNRFLKFANYLRTAVRESGLDGVYLIKVNSHGSFEAPSNFGMDASMEFPPHLMKTPPLYKNLMSTKAKIKVFDMRRYIDSGAHLTCPNHTHFKTIFPGWDNTARKARTGAYVFENFSIETYKKWLSDSIRYTKNTLQKDEKFVFINAWNEWAEGAHLEPDQKNGYAHLQATLDVMNELHS